MFDPDKSNVHQMVQLGLIRAGILKIRYEKDTHFFKCLTQINVTCISG